MDAILELLFTIVIEIVNLVKFKNPKTRVRAMTVVFSLLFTIVFGVAICGAIGLFQAGSIIGAIVMGVIALVVIVAGLFFIIRGHKTNWEKY